MRPFNLKILFFVVFHTGLFPFDCFSQTKEIDSLTLRLKQNLHDTDKVYTLCALSFSLYGINADSTIFLGNQAVELSRIIEFKKGELKGLTAMGIGYWARGDYAEALKHYKLSLKISEDINDKKGMANAYGNIGMIHWNQGNYASALNFYFNALIIHEEIGNKSGIAATLGNIGNLYNRMSDYNNALKYYFKAIEKGEEMGDKNRVAIQLGNVATVYEDIKDYTKCMEYYFKALKLREELGAKSLVASTLGNIGYVYADRAILTANTDSILFLRNKALEHYFAAKNIADELGDKNTITIWTGAIGVLYFEMGKLKESEEFLLQALLMSNNLGSLEHQKTYHKNLSNFYNATGNNKLAFQHYKDYSAAKDSIFNESKSKEIGKLEAKYEFEKQQEEEERLKFENLKLEIEKKQRRNNLQYSGIFVFVLLLFVLLSLSMKLSMSEQVAEGLIFFTFLLFFEFCLVLLDPYIENFSSGEPAYKLLLNAVLAALIFPLHSFFENILKKKIMKTEA